MNFDEVYSNGYSTIMSKYAIEQRNYIQAIAKLREMPVEWLQAAKGIFIPNNEFMLREFGPQIQEYDCYRDGVCVWWNALIFPVRDIDNRAAGLAGFFPFIYADENDDSNYYAYSSSSVFQKGRYLYFPTGNLIDAIEAGYLLLVDGIFDAISLAGNGYVAAALMGSKLTQEILMQLRFVPKVIIVSDNDQAGFALYEYARKYLKNVMQLKHRKTKDADEALKSEYAQDFKSSLDNAINSCVLKTISPF